MLSPSGQTQKFAGSVQQWTQVILFMKHHLRSGLVKTVNQWNQEMRYVSWIGWKLKNGERVYSVVEKIWKLKVYESKLSDFLSQLKVFPSDFYPVIVPQLNFGVALQYMTIHTLRILLNCLLCFMLCLFCFMLCPVYMLGLCKWIRFIDFLTYFCLFPWYVRCCQNPIPLAEKFYQCYKCFVNFVNKWKLFLSFFTSENFYTIFFSKSLFSPNLVFLFQGFFLALMFAALTHLEPSAFSVSPLLI